MQRGPLICSRLHSHKVEEDFYLFLASIRARALRSLIIAGASYHRKTMRTLNLLTDAANRRKTMGTLKLLTESMQYNFTMGTLKLLTESMQYDFTVGTLKLLTESTQYDFTVALDHIRVIRPFF